MLPAFALSNASRARSLESAAKGTEIRRTFPRLIPALDTSQFLQRTLIVFGIAVLLLALWKLAGVLLLIFGGIIIALLIRSAADWLARHTSIDARWGSLLVVLLVVAVVAGLFIVFGDDIARQVQQVRESVPRAMTNAKEWLRTNELGRAALSTFNSGSISAKKVFSTTWATFGIFSDLVLLLLIALYLSIHPGRYREGLVKLVPVAHKEAVDSALRTSGSALHGWLLGQMISMFAVGVLTGIGLWIAGVPLAFMLGVIAGLLEFVPVLGPFAAAVPGILLAFSVSPTTAAYAALVYFIVQQLEGALIMPLAQRWSVHLPPVLGLIAIVVFGVLFGLPGILLATPLAVVLMALVKRFYLHQSEQQADGRH